MKLTSKRLRAGALAAAIVVGGGGALVLGAGSAGASNKEVTAAGSFTTYQVMHDLFPTSINDLLPGGTTSHQKIVATATYCAGGITFTKSTVTYTGKTGAPNGSGKGKHFLYTHEQALPAATDDKKGCVTIGRSSSPPAPTTTTTGTTHITTLTGAHFDYYAYALDGVAPMVGLNAGGTALAPQTLSLQDMKDIYACAKLTTSTPAANPVTTWTEVPGLTGTTAGAPIVRFWPQTGSGTRAVYTSLLGFTPETLSGKNHCATAAITTFKTVTVGSSVKTEPNEENTESGLFYATHVLTATNATPAKSHHTIKDDVYIYSAGKFVSEWNLPTEYNKTTGHDRINTAHTGNFTPTNVELAKMKTQAGTSGHAFVTLTSATTTNPKRTGRRAHVTTSTVNETNEWYSHLANASTAGSSTASVPGVRYIFNVCDTTLPSYNTCKAMVGFDNQLHLQATTQTNGTGTISRLCSGADAATIIAAGFVPLTTTVGPTPTDNKASTTCREFPGGAFPGHAATTAYTHWTFNTWVNPTT